MKSFTLLKFGKEKCIFQLICQLENKETKPYLFGQIFTILQLASSKLNKTILNVTNA